MQEPQTGTIRPDARQIDAEHWQRLQETFHLLQRTPAHEREALLDSSVVDAALRERLRALLQAAQEEEADGPAVSAGKQVGPYPLLRYLGSGGLGTVYLTERLVGGAVQPCAIKLLSAPLSQSGFRARFEREQQILASLSHPNITHLLDAGVGGDHQPYLVMEYVDGQDLSLYCRERRLTVAQRLTLFVDICTAVAYAHRSLIVHLDLKPSNVMVTRDGTVKLLDFGTSKLIDEDGTMTATVLATPAYSSPEQLRGEPVTTSCDLYSLGAMLYEVLSGQRPFEATSIAMAVSRAAQEHEPPRMTTVVHPAAAEERGLTTERLRQVLEGDLASIVARCLRSRPQDRYASVDALAEDLRRYLAGRPVLARRQTATYRLAKFGRRHRLPLAVSTLALAALVFAAVFSFERQQQALREGRRAEQMQNFLSQLLKLANQKSAGKPAATLPDFLQLGVTVLPDYIKDPADRRSARLSLAESMFDIRDPQHALPILQQVVTEAHDAKDLSTEVEANAFGGRTAADAGNIPLARQMLDQALTLSRQPQVSDAARVRAEGFFGLINISLGFDRDGALKVLRQGVEHSRSSHVSEQERLWLLEIAANTEALQGDLKQAEQDAQMALAIVDRLPPSAQYDRELVLLALANLRTAAQDPAGSIPLLQRAYSAAVSCCGAESIDALAIQMFQARALIATGEAGRAISLLESILPGYKIATHGSQDYTAPLIALTRAYLSVNEFSKAEKTAREALQVGSGRLNAKAARAAQMHLFLAQALHGQNRDAEALTEVNLAQQSFASSPTMGPMEKPFRMQTEALAAQLSAPRAHKPGR